MESVMIETAPEQVRAALGNGRVDRAIAADALAGLPLADQAEVLDELSPPEAADILEDLEDAEADVLDEMEPDEAADVPETTVTDCVGFGLFLGLATLFLEYLA
jgi:Mg/Co/Ni transporter MgtE